MSASDGLIAGYSLTEPDEGSDDILAAFRALGGVADNIRVAGGPFGGGLFPIVPDQPFRLHVPKNLMFPVEEVGFAGDRMRIRAAADVPGAEREFFAKYSDALSWGGGGRQKWSALMAAFDALPNDVRALLAADFGMAGWIDDDRLVRAQRHFLQSRIFEVDGKDVVIPVLELARHDGGGLQWRIEGGVDIDGQASGEILLSYGLHDPFSMFHRFAVASREGVAFSLPMSVQIGAIDLAVGRSFEVVRRGNAMLPRLRDSGHGIELSFLTLGHPKFPRLPRGTFRALMKPLGIDNADEEFDRILHANWSAFLKLLAALEAHSGGLIVSLRNMAQYQLEAMSFCIGARDI